MADQLKACAAQLHRAKQDLVRRNVQIETCMQYIIDKARKGRDRPDADAFDETACQGAIDAILQLAHDLGIEGVK